MQRTHRCGLLLSLPIALLLLACGGRQAPSPTVETAPEAPAAEQPRYGGSLSFAIQSDPDGGFDPHIPGGRGRTRSVIGIAQEYLAFYDVLPGEECGYSPKLLLAESWRFVDPTTIDVALKKGINFHNLPPVNGRELVADDIVFSYKRLFDRGMQRTLAQKVADIQSVDRHTVRITLRSPHVTVFEDLFSYFGANILPKEAGGPEGNFDGKESVIGTGPFVMDGYTPGVGHVFKRNPNYWIKGRPYLDEIRVAIMKETATQYAAFRTGKVDFLWSLSLSDAKSLVDQGAKARMFRCELSGVSTIQMRNDIPPFNDVRVRRAMSMATDREGLIKGVYGGEGFPVVVARRAVEGALKPEDLPADVRKYFTYNPAEAKRLLAEAGHPDGLSLTVTGGLRDALTSTLIEALPSMAKPAGFNITLNVPDMPDFDQRMDSWNYGVAAVSRRGGGGIGIEGEVSGNHSRDIPGRNRAAVKDPELDRLIDQMLVTLDQQERWKVAAQIQTRMADQAYWVSYPSPLVYYPLNSAFKGEVRLNAETVFYRSGLMFLDVWRGE